MGGPTGLESAANRCEAGSAALDDSDVAKVQTEARVCRGSFQDAKPLPPVVCELEYLPLPPVCVADDRAAAADAAKARGETLDCPANKDMPPCPDEWDDAERTGWKQYEGMPSFFHCGFRGLVADCSPDRDHLQQECFYNEAGQLIKDAHDTKKGDYVDIDFRCAGTPNADDAREHPKRHVVSTGGIIDAGWTGFVGSILHDDRVQHELENETDPPDSDDRN